VDARNKVPDRFPRAVVMLLSMLLGLILVLWFFWDRFLVDVFSAPPISFWDATGLGLVVGLVYLAIFMLKEDLR
jgi:hypothetical protein